MTDATQTPTVTTNATNNTTNTQQTPEGGSQAQQQLQQQQQQVPQQTSPTPLSTNNNNTGSNNNTNSKETKDKDKEQSDESDSEIDEDDSEEDDEEDDEEEEEEEILPKEPGIIDSLPEGWYRGGSSPGLYKMGLDERCYRTGSASAFIQSVGVVQGEKYGFGTVCQTFFPKDYLSKRIRLTAFLRYELFPDSQSWVGIWLKSEFPSSNMAQNLYRLDNMSDRKLVGSSKGDWAKAEIVNDIPMSCISCTFGFLLFGGGQVWADDFQFEVVDKSVPLTGVPAQKTPINLSFGSQKSQ